MKILLVPVLIGLGFVLGVSFEARRFVRWHRFRQSYIEVMQKRFRDRR